MSEFYADSENSIKLPENVDGFEDNCLWTSCVSFSELWQEYMWSTIHVLKSGHKISHTTKRHDTKLHFFDINETLG